MASEPGDVVFWPFPDRDRLAESVRPAVIVSRADFNQRGGLIVAAVTTHTPRLPTDVELQDWKLANLAKPSTVRMLIATVAEAAICATRWLHPFENHAVSADSSAGCLPCNDR